MRTIKITIANKRLIQETGKSYMFSVSGYGKKDNVFFIPKVAVEFVESALIPINEATEEPATTYTIHLWLYEKIKRQLDKMSKYHFTMPNTQM